MADEAKEEELSVKLAIHHAVWTHVEKGQDVSTKGQGVCQVCDLGEMLFFQIGSINYALKAGMPVVSQETDDRVVVIFASKKAGVHYGLSAPNNEETQALLALLKSKMFLEVPTEEEKKAEEKAEKSKVARAGNKLASIISKGGKLGGKAIEKGTEATKKGIRKGVEVAKKKVKPKDEATKVSDKTKARVEKAKQASGMAVQVSSAMLKGAMETANQLSDQLNGPLSEYLEKKGLKTGKPDGPKAAAAKNVGKQSVKVAIELYIAMKEASVQLMGEVLDAGAELVDHRYGADAGSVAKDASGAGKNALKAASNVGGLGMKAVGKKIAADTVLKSIDDPKKGDDKREAKKAASALVDSAEADPDKTKPKEAVHAAVKTKSALEMD